jgi:putative tricarboxylic transport membrane protein
MRLTVHSKGELTFAGLLLALGIFVLIEAATIPIPVASSNVGPRFMPYFTGALLTIAAVWSIIEIFRGQSVAPEESELADPAERFSWKNVAFLVGSVLVFILLLDPIGYLLATPIAFFGLLLAFGARRWWVMAIVSVVMPTLIFLFFNGVLGIRLPTGPFAGIL